MPDIQSIDEHDIRDIIEQTCQFDIKDHGIGYYEAGDGKYNDISMQMTLTPQDIIVQYTIDKESLIYTMIIGTYYEVCAGIDYECEYTAELTHIEYNRRVSGFDATYEVDGV
jgi:hypothetical protein